jgi:hypothetical protein
MARGRRARLFRALSEFQQGCKAISGPDRNRPDHCPQCEAKQPLTGHGFYRRTLVDPSLAGVMEDRLALKAGVLS